MKNSKKTNKTNWFESVGKMKKIAKTSVLLSLAVAVLSLSYAPAANGEPLKEGYLVDDIYMSSDGVQWSISTGYEQASLRVSTPLGDIVELVFEDQDQPFFHLGYDYGTPLIDGNYNWEVSIVLTGAASRSGQDNFVSRAANLDLPTVEWGTFFVQNGDIVVSDLPEPTPKDQTIDDDLIVTGGICAGFDCVEGHSFGFDNAVYMSNNLRVRFNDTSNTSSFPANDWRIVINDDANGGANYFAVEDSTAGRTPFKVLAGAPTNALYVDSAGEVGIGTSTPVTEVHMVVGDTPTVRLEQDGSGGYAAQIWDMGGNEANFFVREYADGEILPFRIQPGSPQNTVTLRANGHVGIGTWGPSENLEIRTTGESSTLLCNMTDGASAMFSSDETLVEIGSTTEHPVNFLVNDTAMMSIDIAGNVGIGTETPAHPLHMAGGAYCDGNSWVDASSRALKENIEELSCEDAFDTFEELQPVTFNYISNQDENHVGFIAEDVPGLVATNDRKGMSSMDVIAVLTKVVQDQQLSLEQQQEMIMNLQERVEELETR